VLVAQLEHRSAIRLRVFGGEVGEKGQVVGNDLHVRCVRIEVVGTVRRCVDDGGTKGAHEGEVRLDPFDGGLAVVLLDETLDIDQGLETDYLHSHTSAEVADLLSGVEVDGVRLEGRRWGGGRELKGCVRSVSEHEYTQRERTGRATHFPKVVLVRSGRDREVVQEVIFVEVDSLVTNGSTGVEFVCIMRGSEPRKEAEKATEEKTYPREQSARTSRC
jgi:hypothetical protein